MFSKTTFVSLLALVGNTFALQVTSPASQSSYDISSSIPIVWSSVSTDPSTFNIQLVNEASYPTTSQTLASNIKTSDGKYTIDAGSLSVTGTAFQINLISTSTQNSGILAQSGQFNLTKSASSSSSSSSSASTSKSSSSTSAPVTSSSSSSSATSTPGVFSFGDSTTSSTASSSGFSFGNGTSTATSSTSASTTGASTSGTSSASASASTYTGAATKFGAEAAVVGAGAFMAAMLLA